MSDEITLTSQEVQFIMNELVGRDPVMRLLIEKQMRAQQAEAPAPQPEAPPVDLPMRVNGGMQRPPIRSRSDGVSPAARDDG